MQAFNALFFLRRQARHALKRLSTFITHEWSSQSYSSSPSNLTSHQRASYFRSPIPSKSHQRFQNDVELAHNYEGEPGRLTWKRISL